MIIIKNRSTARAEKGRILRQNELVRAHNFGRLGRHWYSEDKNGARTGEKGKPYLSPIKLGKES